MPTLGYAAGVAFHGLYPGVRPLGRLNPPRSAPAGWLGKRLGERMAKRAELAGGLVLVGIGSKILIEHLA